MYSVCLQSLIYCMNMVTIQIIFCMWQKDKGDLFIKLVCLFSDVIFCQCLLCLKRRFSIWMLRFLYQYSALRSLHSITNHRCYSYFEHLWADICIFWESPNTLGRKVVCGVHRIYPEIRESINKNRLIVNFELLNIFVLPPQRE